MSNKKSAAGWLEILNHIEIPYFEGWNRTNISVETAISYKKFQELARESTVYLKGGFPKEPIWNPYFDNEQDAKDELKEAGFNFTPGKFINYPYDYIETKATEAAIVYLTEEKGYATNR